MDEEIIQNQPQEDPAANEVFNVPQEVPVEDPFVLEHLSRIEMLMENQQIMVNDIINLLADFGLFFVAFTAVIIVFYVLFKEALRW